MLFCYSVTYVASRVPLRFMVQEESLQFMVECMKPVGLQTC